jgi:hypothetical protein
MHLRYLCVFVFVSISTFAQTPPAKQSKTEVQEPETANGSSLPVKRVVLYKNGVGYFEHAGRVHGNQDLAIEFTTAQLNDVLKSLTLVDLNGGSISGVRYNSIAPLSERLKSLQIPLSENVTSAAFLIALRGTKVEVRSGATTAVGKVFSVETVQKEASKGGTISVTQLAIVTDAGELRVFELGPGVTVRAAENEIRQDVNRYLNLVGSTRSKDVRRMTISAEGTGNRDLFVSYISEVPVWKSTYRIVVPKAPGTPFLQGWAIVDNTVGEDWKDVNLALVSGAPQSFIQDISQPYYTRRPVVPLPESVMLTPQAHEASMEEEPIMAAYTPPSPPPLSGPGVVGGVAGGSMGGVVGGIGSGSDGGVGGGAGSAGKAPKLMTESVEVDAAEVNTSRNSVLTAAMRAGVAAAEGSALGELFQYALKEKITVLKNQSALVPIVQSPIDAEKVTLVTATGNGETEGTPLRALWVTNTSGLTLDGGTFNILEEDSFAGEGIMEVLHPKERRLLSYAADTAVHVTGENESESQRVTRVIIVKGVMKMIREKRDTTTYTIHNADTTARQVVVEHPIRDGWVLGDGLKPTDVGTAHYRFRVAVEPGKTEKLLVKETRPEESRVQISSLSENQVTVFVEEKTIKPDVEAQLRAIIEKKYEIFNVDQEIKVLQTEMEGIDKDQARLRENMKALKGSAEEKALLQRYTKQLDGQEDRLLVLQNEIKAQKLKRVTLQQQLDGMVEAVAVNETL